MNSRANTQRTVFLNCLARLKFAQSLWRGKSVAGLADNRPVINETRPKMRILVANDHAVVRAGLKTILSAREGWEICAEAETGDEAVAFAKECRPDVAILDLNMPGITGLQASAEIKKSLPGIELVILTCHYSGPLLQAIIKSGALGFVLKSDADRDLVAAVEAVWRGEPYVSRHIDAMLPASPRSTPLFMLLAESDLLTGYEREQVRLVAKQMRHLL
jgi:DNA-binding NarL/FixJ family response regulator